MPRATVNIKDLTFSEDVLPRMVREGPLVDEFTKIIRMGVKDGTQMGMGTVFHDGKTFWVADGAKRLTAQERCGFVRPFVDLKKGSKADAIWYAAGANREHGVRLSNKEKRQAVTNMLSNKAIADSYTDGALAVQVGVDEDLVRKMRQSFVKNDCDDRQDAPSRRVGRDGKSYPRKGKPAGPGRPRKEVAEAKKGAEESGASVEAAVQKARVEVLLNNLQKWIDSVPKAKCLSKDELETFRMALDVLRAPFKKALGRLG